MKKLMFTDKELKEIYEKAKNESRTVLGIIYSGYIYPLFPNTNIISPSHIHVNRNFVMSLIDMDIEIMGEAARGIYFNYGPSISEKYPLKELEIIITL